MKIEICCKGYYVDSAVRNKKYQKKNIYTQIQEELFYEQEYLQTREWLKRAIKKYCLWMSKKHEVGKQFEI